MEQRPGQAKEVARRLRSYRRRYERVKARLRELGFIVRGSFVRQRLPCGNQDCRCRKHAKYRHGPYYSITWKEKGRTVSRFLPTRVVALYRRWNRNARLLKGMLVQMHRISQAAADCARAAEITCKAKNSRKGRRVSD
jgi:hypothetical protein